MYSNLFGTLRCVRVLQHLSSCEFSVDYTTSLRKKSAMLDNDSRLMNLDSHYACESAV